MAVVTRDSRSAVDGRERDFVSAEYVRVLLVEARERRERSRSLRVCSVLSLGRLGVSIPTLLARCSCGWMDVLPVCCVGLTLVFLPCAPGEDL